jgi:SAM-dependent methyltransferase
MCGMSEYDAWADIYDDWVGHADGDVAFYAELARAADGPIVELAVGTGRVAIPVARETGKRILGLDSSAAMLDVARGKAHGLPVELRQADMRDFALDEPAALIYVPGRSLLHLRGWQEKRDVFCRVAASLRPGGRFAFNCFVFVPRIAAELDGVRQQTGGVVHTSRYVAADNRIEIERDDGATIPLWWMTRAELEGLLDVAGLETEALYGSFDKRPLDDESSEYVWIARKPAQSR